MTASVNTANSVLATRTSVPLPVSRKTNLGRDKGGASKDARRRVMGATRNNVEKVINISTNSVAEKVTACCTVLFEVYKLYGFDSKYNIELDIKRYLSVISRYNLHWISLFKYKLALFTAWATDSNEKPDSIFPEGSTDDHPFLFGRKAKRFVLALKERDERQWCSFAASVAQSKKGFPRASPSDLSDAARKTFDLLTQPPERKTTYLLNRQNIHPFHSLETLGQQVLRTVDEIFSDFKIGSFTEEMFSPSLNANYNFTNSELGTFGLFIQKGLLKDHLKEKDQEFLEEVFRTPKVVELLDVDKDEMDSESDITTVLEMKDFTRLKSIFDSLYWEVYKLAVKEIPLAQPVPLAESLKVRVITKGPPFTYFVLKAFQRKIHSHLRKHRLFRLIGEPVTSDVINSVFTKPRQIRARGQKILSVDYSSATDKIDPFLSEICVNRICDIMGCEPNSSLRDLFIKAMTRHEMTIRVSFTEKIYRKQESGQLMGSIVSFPILCIINAAVMRVVAETANNRLIRLDNLKCLINGDDAVLLTNDSGRECWYKLAPIAGLYPSIGKILYSDRILNMNSTYFLLPSRSLADRFELVPYVNMGLVAGMKRSSGKVGTADLFDSLSNIGARHRDLYRTSPFWLWDKIHALFVRQHDHIFSSISKSIPWYIPECYGGLGMVGQPSKADLRIVSAMIAGRHDSSMLPVLPHSRQSTSISSFALRKIPKELTFRYVHPLSMSELDKELQRDYDQLFDKLCLWSIFCHSRAVAQERKANFKAALKHNERLWQKLMKASRSSSPILNRFSRVILPGEKIEDVSQDVLIPFERVPNFFIRYLDIS